MVALDVVALAAVGHRPHEHRLIGAEVVAGVALGGFAGQLVAEAGMSKTAVVKWRIVAAVLVGDVAGHGQGLQVDLRAHHRRADVQQHAAFEPVDVLGEDEEIGVAGRAGGGRVEIGVLVDDVLPDAHVDGHRHAEPDAGGQHARLAVGELLLFDHPADRLAQPDAVAAAGRGGVVDPAGLVPQAELPGG